MEQHGLKIEVLENKNYYMHIKNLVFLIDIMVLSNLRRNHDLTDILDFRHS